MAALLIASCALLVLAAAPSAAAKNGFSFGVAAGDVSQHAAKLWAHAKKAGKATLELQSRGRPRCDEGDQGEPKAKAKKSDNFTINKKVKGLAAGTEYLFRFCFGDVASKVGSFETPPAKGKSKTIEFAITGDYDAQKAPGASKPYWNNFDVFKRMLGENNDFNLLLGDTIYTDTEVPDVPTSEIALSVKQKWGKYRMNLKQKKLAALRSSATTYSHWDDHEFINDFARGMNEFGGTSQIPGAGLTATNGETLYQRGVRAFRDYAPVTYSKQNGLYRTFQWGKNLEIFMPDERSFRSTPADYQGVCNNPSTGEPDLVPTAPQSYRDQFALLIPSLATPVSQQCLDTINDPNRTMLGQAQFNRLVNDVATSVAKWKVIVNEVPIQQLYVNPYDYWEGYAAERRRLIDTLNARGVRNLVFLTTDIHANLYNEINFNSLGPDPIVHSGYFEIITGPAATATFAVEADRAAFSGANAVLYNRVLKPQPPDGVGTICAAIDRFSYAQVKVKAGQLTVNYKDIKGQPVQETSGPDVKGTCAPIVFNAQ